MRLQESNEREVSQFWRRLGLVAAVATSFVVVVVLLMASLFG